MALTMKIASTMTTSVLSFGVIHALIHAMSFDFHFIMGKKDFRNSTSIIICVSFGARLLSSCGALVLSSSATLRTVSPLLLCYLGDLVDLGHLGDLSDLGDLDELGDWGFPR